MGDEPERQRLKAMIRSRALTESVLLTGPLRPASSLLPLADIYVHYAKVENLPLSVLEAARAGLPLACTPAGGVRKMMVARWAPTPSLILPTTARHGKRCDRLLQSQAWRREVGQRIQANFHEQFSADAMVRGYRRILA